MLPASRDEFSSHAAWHDNRTASRQADLPAVCVACQHELKSRVGDLGESLGAMREQDRTFILGNAATDLREVMGFVKMWIVDPAEPKARAVPLESSRLVEQNRQADFFEVGNHLDEVVVAKDAEPHRSEHGANPLQLPKARPVVAVYAISEITREDRRIMRRNAHEIFEHGGQFGIEIAVKVAELQKAESIKGRRKRGELPLLLNDLNIEKLPAQSLANPEDSKHPADQRVEGNQPFQTKNSLALMKKFRALAGLALQALLKMRRP